MNENTRNLLISILDDVKKYSLSKRFYLNDACCVLNQKDDCDDHKKDCKKKDDCDDHKKDCKKKDDCDDHKKDCKKKDDCDDHKKDCKKKDDCDDHKKDCKKKDDCDDHKKDCKKKDDCDEEAFDASSSLVSLFEELSLGTEIRIVTDSGDVIEGRLIDFNERYAYVILLVTNSSLPTGEVTYVDALKVESVAFVG
ncbi:hypothetical protein PU629_12520 [Pullulanibacillus sp. KACC 23026]|uniref:hypothetical protein n=1 Tax=Pullulanibacillus sp. KACC 23026 TaxID=3028315 RepID=UPI0023AF5804|nr:hypothetical protein [Pullulanibacillus sp. KACC 23026]WEG11001.1 hypothetical protein PU629_12520 [Pullulanibacillus sp. KACC 23026]